LGALALSGVLQAAEKPNILIIWGDRDEFLPTRHGFDEFFGNLYHLNAEDEPEHKNYPKDPNFRKRFGPRGVLHSFADGKIQDTGPLTKKRMETADDEFTAHALKFMDKAVQPRFRDRWRSHRRPSAIPKKRPVAADSTSH
jgi:arylsulfatase A-like enzyme